MQENQRFSILIQTKNAKAIIGTVLPTSPPGILILEDSNKAMVLPKVASPHLNIIKPSAGMMVYDTTSKMFAVFNGTNWIFWNVCLQTNLDILE